MARKPTSGQQEKIQRVLPGHETQGQTSTDSGTSSGGKSGTGGAGGECFGAGMA